MWSWSWSWWMMHARVEQVTALRLSSSASVIALLFLLIRSRDPLYLPLPAIQAISSIDPQARNDSEVNPTHRCLDSLRRSLSLSLSLCPIANQPAGHTETSRRDEARGDGMFQRAGWLAGWVGGGAPSCRFAEPEKSRVETNGMKEDAAVGRVVVKECGGQGRAG